jgi:uncharacterized membrane protein YccC
MTATDRLIVMHAVGWIALFGILTTGYDTVAGLAGMLFMTVVLVQQYRHTTAFPDVSDDA